MIVTLEEMKQYLRVDFEDDDQLIADFIVSAESLCKDVLRTDDDTVLAGAGNGKAAVMYTVAYLYEHREEARPPRFDSHPPLPAVWFKEGGILMNIELLNVRIFISKNEVVIDAIGNHKNVWKEYYTCYATVSAEAGKEETSAGLVVDNSKVDFTIRWCRKAAEIAADKFRVEFNGELYNILAVNHMNYRKKCIKLSCEKARR